MVRFGSTMMAVHTCQRGNRCTHARTRMGCENCGPWFCHPGWWSRPRHQQPARTPRRSLWGHADMHGVCMQQLWRHATWQPARTCKSYLVLPGSLSYRKVVVGGGMNWLARFRAKVSTFRLQEQHVKWHLEPCKEPTLLTNMAAQGRTRRVCYPFASSCRPSTPGAAKR